METLKATKGASGGAPKDRLARYCPPTPAREVSILITTRLKSWGRPSGKRIAVAVPLTAMVLSDLALGAFVQEVLWLSAFC